MSLWFGHGCFGQLMLSEHERYYGWAWMLWSAYALGTRTLLWFGHGCFVSVWSRNTNDVVDARRRVAANAVRPFFYTLDPKVLPNDIAVELFALLLKNSSDAFSFLFWGA